VTGPTTSSTTAPPTAPPRADEREPVVVLWRRHTWSVRFLRRAALVNLALLAAAAVLGVVALTFGDYGISVGQVVAALRGHAGDPLAAYFVTDVRLPRVLGALLVGVALGISGSLFQTISGNPLGSPDVVGFTTGSATGALVAIILVGASPAGVAAGSVVGGVATAAVIYALAWRGGVSGMRLVLVGVGIGAALHAVNALLVVRAPLGAAQTAAQWQAGSLNGVTWRDLAWLAGLLVVVAPVLVLLFRGLTTLSFGDDLATELGVRVGHVRLGAVAAGVALVALATAVTGPIAFVALAAPHVVRRLHGTTTPALTGSALTGAVLVLVSDMLAQRLLAPTQLAVGVVTAALGGVYLVALLAFEWRKRTP